MEMLSLRFGTHFEIDDKGIALNLET